MSQSARDVIFDRLHNASNNNSTEVQDIQAQAKSILTNSPHAVLATSDPVDAFVSRINNGKVIGTTCEKLDSIESLPSAVYAYLQANDLSLDVGIQQLPLFENIEWSHINNTGPQLSGELDGLVSLTYADFGIAETGSVVFHSGENRPVLLNFLSLHQIIVIHRKNIVLLLDDYASQLDITQPPRNTIWITGASGTTDIEGVLVQGAHGPCQVHVLIL